MANHHLLDSHGKDTGQQDSWQALTTGELPDGIALSEISLTELLKKLSLIHI